MGMPILAINSLDTFGGIEFVGQLVQKTDIDLLKLKFFGRACLKKVKHVLDGLGLSLGMDVAWKNQTKKKEVTDA